MPVVRWPFVSLIGKDAGEDFYLIGFAALRGVTALTGAALVEKSLDFGLSNGKAGRAAVNNAANRRAMAFAPRCDAKKVAKTIVRHRRAFN